MPTERTDREKVIFLAERVMGWKVSRPKSIGPGTEDIIEFRDEHGSRIMWWPKCGTGDRGWNPLTDPVASKQIIDRMWDLGYWCQSRNRFDLESKYCWAGFTMFGSTGWNEGYNNLTSGDTVEIAVADAAIAAIEGEQE